MKKLAALMLLLLCAFAAPAFAQTLAAPAPPQLAEMKKLDFLAGQWQGEGWIVLGPGQRRTFRQTETVQNKVGGTVLLIEGLGKGKVPGQAEEVTIHNAFAVVSYDDQAKAFRWRAFRADGVEMDAAATVTERNIVWGFRDPRAGEVRFTIKLNEAGQWFEVGELNRDGKTWFKFFEMTLQRVK